MRARSPAPPPTAPACSSWPTGHPAARRDRRPAARPPGQAPARARGGRDPAGRGARAEAGRRARHRGHAKPLERRSARASSAQDLFYRLNVVRLHCRRSASGRRTCRRCSPTSPPGRQRLGRPVSDHAGGAGRADAAPWPGNVRELRNAVERAAVLGTGGPLDPRDFAIGERQPQRRKGQRQRAAPRATARTGRQAARSSSRPRSRRSSAAPSSARSRPRAATAARRRACSASASGPCSTRCGGCRSPEEGIAQGVAPAATACAIPAGAIR